jgi:hypothetical protein
MRLRQILLLFAVTVATSTVFGQRPSAMKTVHPAENNDPLTNPYMGWGIWAGPRYLDGRQFSLERNTTEFGDDAPLFGWVLIDWVWADLEPEEGKYNWNELDAIIDYWAARKKQVYLRPWITDDPGWDNTPGSDVFPKWLATDGVKFREYLSQGKFKKVETDYMDPSYKAIYLPKAKRFLTALAARYDKPDGPVIMWGALGYGQWGEWHTLWSHYPWPNEDAKHAVLTSIVDMYADVFKVHPVVISYCFDWDNDQVTGLDDFLYRQGLDEAISKHFGLARHGFIDGLRLYDHMTMEKNWRTSLMWGEGNWTYLEVKDQGTHGTLQENIDVFKEWHSDYAHLYMDAEGYKRAMKDDRAVFEDSLRSGGLGYRLVPTSVSWPEELAAGDLLVMPSKWVNRNVGRAYVRFPLKIYLTDSSGKEVFSAVDQYFSATGLVQGEESSGNTLIELSPSITAGTYDVRIALVDERGKPSVRMPIAGEDTQLRYKLGTIEIRSKRTKQQ